MEKKMPILYMNFVGKELDLLPGIMKGYRQVTLKCHLYKESDDKQTHKTTLKKFNVQVVIAVKLFIYTGLTMSGHLH